MRVVIVGTSTRAIADSAARAGFQVTAVDGFADLDQHPAVDTRLVTPDASGLASAGALASAAACLPADAVAYLSPFENHPDLVARLAAGRTLLGNTPDVLRRVRDPRQVMTALRRRGFAVPDTRLSSEVRLSGADCSGYLSKPIASGGGHGVRLHRSDETPADDRYLQRWVSGTPASVVFLAAAGRAVPLAVSRQLVGEPGFGADGFRYCGNIVSGPSAVAGPGCASRAGGWPADAAVSREAGRLAEAAADEFGLAGVNGIDFVASAGRAVPVEINPRWSASIELVERVTGSPIFSGHACACLAGELPSPDSVALRPGHAWGKAVVFARHACLMGDAEAWLADPDIRDVPRRGETIAAGHPICTVFASGPTDGECFERLVERASAVYRAMG